MLGTDWAKSSYSQKGADNCVECRATTQKGVAVRDSQNPLLCNLSVAAAEWAAFIQSTKRERF